MISKIFNSDSANNRVLEVGRYGECPWMNIRDGVTGDKMFRIKLEDMPEILRALADVTAGAEAEVEAKEQAELEAEALDLFNASQKAIGAPPHSSVDAMGSDVNHKWLAVARRAREMRAEK